jgi:hypothetical protein
LSVNGDPGTDVHFTNTVIIPDGKHTELKNPRDCLVIPKKIGQTNLSLSISVHDGSAIDVDSLETIVSVPQDMKCFFEGWNGASWPKDFFRKSSVSEPGDFGPAEMKTFCFKELSLLHFNSTVLPEIKVVVSPNPHEWYSVLILTKAKQSTPRGTFFNVAFIAFQDDVPVKPFFGKILKTADGKKEYIAIPAELKVINE